MGVEADILSRKGGPDHDRADIPKVDPEPAFLIELVKQLSPGAVIKTRDLGHRPGFQVGCLWQVTHDRGVGEPCPTGNTDAAPAEQQKPRQQDDQKCPRARRLFPKRPATDQHSCQGARLLPIKRATVALIQRTGTPSRTFEAGRHLPPCAP